MENLIHINDHTISKIEVIEKEDKKEFQDTVNDLLQQGWKIQSYGEKVFKESDYQNTIRIKYKRLYTALMVQN